jgi:amino acid adenylation domain-containing protein
MYMVADSGMPVLITTSALERELGFEVSAVLCIDRDDLAAGPAAPLGKDRDSADPESVAYVIYTSGSTGKPKGVLVPHRAVTNLVSSVAKQPGMTSADSVLAITTLSFDIAVSEIWVPLVVGAKIVMVSREIAADGALLRTVCERSGVTFIDATPATYRLLLAAGWRGSNELTLICTGEAMPRDLALELPKHGKAVWNGYGPTETTVWSTFWRVPPGTSRVLIGRPVDNTRIYVLDARRQPVPIGVSGELYIAGVGVTHGYLNRPELTAERFLADPFAAAGALMYRTGDVGRYLSSGDIECLGRNDNQVKLRGFRIELGEIEDALTQNPLVRSAAVILREDRPGDMRLVGYVVPETEGASLEPAELRKQLQQTLPDYMVPTAFVPLAKLPLTPSGKIDRRALPAPDASSVAASADFVAPRNESERLLAELWASALGVTRVSIHDDFFALGGHSLLASQILARLRRDHGIELSFRKFFEAPSVARLAELIDGASPATASSTPAIVRRAPGTSVPLSLIQERLWLLEEMHPAQAVVHNLPAAWRFRGPIDVGLLQSSIDRIAVRHETLRMTVGLQGSRAVQQIAERVELPVASVDLRQLPAAEREAAMYGQIRELSSVPFDLKRGPLFRSTLFRLGDEDYLYFTLRHNIVWDGWSFDIFLNELCATYAALARGDEPKLEPLPVSYGDYVLWQREWVKGPELARQVAWWQSQLSGSPADLELPRDRPRPSTSTYAGANLSLSVSRAEADALTAIAHGAGTTLFTLVFAAYTVLLYRFSDQREVLVGTPVRARNLPEVEGLIGPFINAVVLRSRLDPEQPFLDYLGSARNLTLDAFSHQDMPLELLGSRPPVVRAFFSFQDARSRPLQLGDVPLTQVDVEPPAAANDLMLWLMDRPHELTAVANFSTEIFEPATMQRMLRSFVTLLGSIVADPNRRLAELDLLSDEDRRALAGRAAPPAAPPPRGLEQLLTWRASETPDAPAFVQRAEGLTFSELSSRARELAARLEQHGIEPGDGVAISVRRSPALAVAVVGVLLAGAAVVMLDPASPDAYRQRILAATTPRLVLHVAADGAWELVQPSQAPRAGSAPRAWLRCRFADSGEPVLAHATLAKLLEESTALAKLLGLEGGQIVALSAAPACELLARELLLPLIAGVQGRLASAEAHGGEALAELLDDPAVAVAFASPNAWLEHCAVDAPPNAALSAVVNGPAGELITEQLLPRVGAAYLLRVSRETDAAFAQRIEPGVDAGRLGKPLAASVRVLSRAGTELPIGAVGDLVLDGERCAGGARLRADGGVELLLSERDPVELGDFALFPGQVGAELARHSAISGAFVRAERAESGGARLVAYYTARAGVPFTETELRRHLRASLPEDLVPKAFVQLPSLPRDEHGGIDAAKLPSPFAAGQGELVLPRTDNERLLAELFCEALNLPQVSVYDNFFDLGGHSLLCFRVLERIEQRLHVRLSPRLLLLNSLEQVAAQLKAQPEAAPVAAAPPADKPAADLKGRVLKKLQGFWRG